MFIPLRISNKNTVNVHPDGFDIESKVIQGKIGKFVEPVVYTETAWMPSEFDVVNLINGAPIRLRTMGHKLPVLWLDTLRSDAADDDFKTHKSEYVDTLLAVCTVLRMTEPPFGKQQTALNEIAFAISKYCEVARK